ncbi:hypothetical protein TBLA_0C04010 [Henningerozyma blattae CBS 6284]|uniref:Calcium-transporting ATPase n=1 Tax=Henningerozyma blattae (strain ATCC 34711 / CBS 6284 / DSM 70876 / NBRC 10599 / NRRL Y-10934 / UCD 77-7) TaxID=1071380 RepID=I2H1E9_HENB6|nr:hypothetical protein TBLA_0C04010 [Tetrapisispora blattae CBS 6284]CCH60201.1 hypothetical protein TBLA_0C04010 [Tetrapisispora blattae CBS 6284]
MSDIHRLAVAPSSDPHFGVSDSSNDSPTISIVSSMSPPFSVSIQELNSLHDPKSILAYKKLYSNDENAFYNSLKTSPIHGIDTFTIDERIQFYNDNKLPQHVPKTFQQLVREAFNDKTLILLSIAAVVSFLLGLYELFFQPSQYDPEGNKITKVDWIEGVAIMFAVVVVVLVSAVNDYQKELQFTKLNAKKLDRVITVIRDNAKLQISINDLLVGDLLSLQTGEVAPADCVLIEGNVEADESTITGESDAVKKHTLLTTLQYSSDHPDNDITNDSDFPDCMIISSSKIISGLGKAIVTSVGINSTHGRTMNALTDTEEDDATPLQIRLTHLADSISIYGSLAGLILFLTLFIKFCINCFKKDGKFVDLTPAEKSSRFMDIFITSITIIVVAVPEGLPLAVTLALAFATTRMTKDGNLVRILRACETMGSATAICSDKTGTLTENSMSVVRGIFGNTFFNKKNSKDILPADKNIIATPLRKDLLANIVLNSTAFENSKYKPTGRQPSINPSDPPPMGSGPVKQEPFIGSKTETALLTLAKRAMRLTPPSTIRRKKDFNLHYIRQYPEQVFEMEKIVQIIPFESSRKWSGVVVKRSAKKYTLFVKGAAEIIFQRCRFKRLSDGSSKYITENLAKEIGSDIANFADNALRAISLTHKDFTCDSWPPREFIDKDDKESADPNLLFGEPVERLPAQPSSEISGFTLDGLVGIQDPLRDGVEKSVELCQKAGVTVRMVTGDNIMTARAIARNCNILTKESYTSPECSMEGPEFRKLTDQQRVSILPKLRVLARSSPEDKRLLVRTLKRMGEVVAATGDGTNDAPALKMADVGFSMGITGTEVAREASDIILMTDDFSAIVNAIKWGRCVSISIKKFIQFQLTVNITAVILTFVSAVSSEDEKSVLTAVQLLWVNLIMDTLAALALATDKPDPNIMNRRPTGRSTPLIAISTWKMIFSQAMLQLVVTFVLHFHGKSIFFPDKESLTGFEQQQLNAMTFNTFVWLQFFTLLVSRKLDEADGISKICDRMTSNNLNFFQDLFRNYYFLIILSIIAIFQTLIMFFGGTAFSIAPQTKYMWQVALFSGMLSLPVGILIRIIPDEWVLKLFPPKVARYLKYILTFEFLGLHQKTRSPDEEEALLANNTNNYNSTTN